MSEGSFGSIPEELLDEVDVGHEHTTAAVASQTELVHGVAGNRESAGDQGAFEIEAQLTHRPCPRRAEPCNAPKGRR